MLACAPKGFLPRSDTSHAARFLTTYRCTVFPGFFHPSGEAVEFENSDNYEPSISTWKKLKRAGSKIAIATELYRAWSAGIRHELTLYTSAMLARPGWSITEVRELITAIAIAANDEELQDRLTSVESTFAAYAQGKQISGEERFIQGLVGGAHPMRTIPLIAITFAALSLSTIGARADGTWCAHYVLHTNCGFYSFEQCQATVSGNGGFCTRNPFSGSSAEPRKRYRRGY